MSKKSFLIRFLCLALAGIVMLASCNKNNDPNPDKAGGNGLYLGVIGFNSEQSLYKISPLNKGTSPLFKDFIDGLTMDDGTNLFHAVNTGVDKLEEFGLPKDLVNVSIVTFTDGLDLTSYKRNPEFSTSGNRAYLKAVHNRVLTERFDTVKLSSYVIGLQGADIRGDETHARFMSDLGDLSSDARNNVFEVKDMSEATERFAEIANKLYSQSVTVNAILRIPADIDEHICITFDDASSVEVSKHYLTGVYNREKRDGKLVGKLTNVKYYGLKSTSGSTVYAVGEKGDFDLFQFDNLNLKYADDTEEPVSIGNNVDQWRKIESASTWVHNSEFNSAEDATKHEEFKSALIMLVLDCSTSLGSDFPKLQSAAKRFIETLAGNYKGNSSGEDTPPSNPLSPTDIETSGYVDLGLPSGLKWAACNLGATTPWGYGGYCAWGETSTKISYTESNSTTYNKSLVTLKSNDIVDANGNLTANYDAAQVLGKGRMPTKADLEELRKECSWTWTSLNGVNGYKVTGPNGKSIFLPAAGYHAGSSGYDVGSKGYYWGAATGDNSYFAYGLFFNSSRPDCGNDYRYYGYSVRPVYREPTPTVSGNFVDLGLSVKWATCNLGASFPEQYGDLYAWGETSTKSSYTESNSQWLGESYSSLKNQGVIDANGNLTANYDVAQKLGKGRMPTTKELYELIEKCSWTWTTATEISGYKVTGPNGNSIFLPAAGSGSGDVVYSYGEYWSSTADGGSYYADYLGFGSDSPFWAYDGRCNGLAVRPVMDK